MPWRCSICGRIYAREDTTRREILNKWWAHMRKYHKPTYTRRKREATEKMLKTKRKRGLIK